MDKNYVILKIILNFLNSIKIYLENNWLININRIVLLEISCQFQVLLSITLCILYILN